MRDEVELMPGDHVTIYPKNFPEDVQTLIDLMEWNDVADKPLRLAPTYPDYYLDKYLVSPPNDQDFIALPNTTLRQLLIHNLDFTAIPKRYFFELISHHTPDKMHKERLFEFSTAKYSDEYFDYATRPRRSILEVLQDFSTVKLPWQWAMHVFPVIRGRQYSIASGGVESWEAVPKGRIRFKILVALVKYRTVLKKVRQGLCSRYIASLDKNTHLSVTFNNENEFYRKARFEPELPLILVGPGTGIAPLRSLIWHRASIPLIPRNRDVMPGKCYLFFGNRNKDADFFYAKDWNLPQLQTTVFTAFSRDQKEKIYVQDIIRREGRLINHLLEKQGAIIYVCGSSGNMPKMVREALMDVMCEANALDGSYTRKNAADALEAMQKNGNFIQETW